MHLKVKQNEKRSFNSHRFVFSLKNPAREVGDLPLQRVHVLAQVRVEVRPFLPQLELGLSRRRRRRRLWREGSVTVVPLLLLLLLLLRWG